MNETLKILTPAMGNLNQSASELRQFRAELDRETHKLPEGDRPAMQAASDEATKLITRITKLQESFRAACLKSK